MSSSRAVGTCAFRLKPTDPLSDAPSTALIEVIGEALLVTYTWRHPEDGEQEGVILVSGASEEGSCTATLFDTWHQHPDVMTLTGSRTEVGTGARLAATYMGDWGWEIHIDVDGADASMTMFNVIPPSATTMFPDIEVGPYEAMVARWRTA